MLTEQQAKNLGTAVTRAKGVAGCLYTRGGEANCVIAQLAVLEGVTLKELAIWDTACMGIAEPIAGIVAKRRPGSEKLSAYPAELLSALQRVWDVPMSWGAWDEESARAVLNNILATQSVEESITLAIPPTLYTAPTTTDKAPAYATHSMATEHDPAGYGKKVAEFMERLKGI